MVCSGIQFGELRDLCKLTSGGTPSKQNEEFWGGEIPWISASSMHSPLVSDSEHKVTKLGASKGTRLVGADTLLILVRGSMLWNRIPICITTREVTFNQDVKAILTDSKLDSRFLFYFLQSQENYLLHKAVGTGIGAGKLETEELLSLPVPLYSKEEKERTVAILTTWDRAIEATEKLLENSKKRKKGLMQQLLTGKKRLPGFSGEWDEFPLSATGKVVSGGTPETAIDKYWGGGLPWLTPTEVTNLKIKRVASTSNTISLDGLKNSSAKLLPPGSLMVCTRATVGTLAISSVEMTTNQGFKNIIPSAGYSVDFLYHLIQFNRKKLIRLSCGSTFLELSKSDFEKIVLPIPTRDEQDAIAKLFETSDQEIWLLEQRLGNLSDEKKALMQQLLTGKKGVKVEAEAT